MSGRDAKASSGDGGIRLIEILGPLSLVTDLGMGSPDEEAMRTCLLATALASEMGLGARETADVYWATLLRHLGCTATAHDEAARLGGNELATRPWINRADFSRPREMVGVLARVGSGHGPVSRTRAVVGMVTGSRWAEGVQAAVCEVASMLAERLSMTEEVQAGVGQMFERWDGKGQPNRLAGEAISPPARFALVAARAMAFYPEGGADGSLAAVRASSGGWLDPEICAVFEQRARALLAEVEAADPLPALLDAEPEPKTVSGHEIDSALEAFADMVDLKSAFTIGHSPGVAGLVGRAARDVGCSDEEAERLRRAALLHDLGRAGIPSGVWEKPGKLSVAERERMQMHAYYSERIVARVPALAGMATIVGMHHERQDGSGYHRGSAGRDIPAPARLLAAADALQTMMEERPHRPAYEPAEAAERLLELAASGALDVDCARAVVKAAGQEAPHVARALPGGLTEREAEVLRLVARGRSNQEIADALVISRRTAEHHVQHIYDKIGVSTRAAATMFAMRHDLVDSPHAL